MATNPAFVYQRRALHSFARLAELVQLTRPLPTGPPQIVTVHPLIVPATATVAVPSGSGGGATLTAQQMYDGFAADALTGGTAFDLPAQNSTATASTIIPALLLAQDVFQDSAHAGDTFTRDGHSYTVRSVADELIAGVVIAILSVATAT